ncbi:hypothetical protein H696_06105 [Fonticula alba]|uniref:Uncharacterized protein n=1 Tax=Fonticula alba TaxID=691883 RepID=A0A058Z048_FONAL|nr:hypothetical protein H696_06105 [Fonticula alba]KCV67466.1 hypothetical protein H696_06105 [Fonticula alba]|eukprot:XP_009498142.1 hypothetical protein H696_06105 [Fonticula alba]
MPAILGRLLLLLMLAVGYSASQPAMKLSATWPAFHLLTILKDPSQEAINPKTNIRFCDFFNSQSLLLHSADGFDDLAYQSSFYNIATSPEARSGRQASRPREFLIGPHGKHAHTCYSYPFARRPLVPFSRDMYFLSLDKPNVDEAMAMGERLVFPREGFIVHEVQVSDLSAMVVGTTAAGRPFALAVNAVMGRLEFSFLQEYYEKHTSLMSDFEGFTFLQATDLDGDGLVDAVTVAWLSDAANTNAQAACATPQMAALALGHLPTAMGGRARARARRGLVDAVTVAWLSDAVNTNAQAACATPQMAALALGQCVAAAEWPHGEQEAPAEAAMSADRRQRGLYWLSRLGEAALEPNQPADVSLLLALPADMEVGQLLVGDFDGDGRASDVAVVSGPFTSGPPRVILLLTSDLASPMTIFLSDMAEGDPAFLAGHRESSCC